MSKQLTVSEQLERARKVVQGWDEKKRSSMCLQGTDNFQERMFAQQKGKPFPSIKTFVNPK